MRDRICTVHHDVVGHQPIADGVQASLREGVAAVGEQQNHATASVRVQAIQRIVDGVEEPGGIAEGQVLVDRADQRVAVPGEVERDEDAAVEAGDDGLVAGAQAGDEALHGGTGELEVHRHAGARVEERRHGDGLQAAEEVGERLALAVVEDLEVFALQVADHPAAEIEHGDGHGNGGDGAPEDGRLLLRRPLRLGRRRRLQRRGGQRYAGDDDREEAGGPGHARRLTRG